MSTTKHLIITERAGSVIEVLTADDRPAIIATDGGSGRMVYFAPEEAPALALAILGAAGVENLPHDSANGAEKALGYLIEHVGLERANAKAAAEREKLGAEALVLFNSTRPDHRKLDEWGDCYPINKEKFTRIALTARTIHGGTK